MGENINEIKNRMWRSAAQMWGGSEAVSEKSFDPLVGMLISACSFELESISRDIEETKLRVSEKLIDMMVPDVNSGILAAHALITARGIEDESMATLADSFYANGDLYDVKPAKLFSFSPAGKFKVLDGSITGMLHHRGYFEMGEQNAKSENDDFKVYSIPEPDTIWLAFKFPAALKQVKNLNVYFNCRKNLKNQNFDYLLRNSVWFGNDEKINCVSGFGAHSNGENILFKIFGEKSVRLNSYLAHVRKFYEGNFVTIDLEKAHLKRGVPAQLLGQFTKIESREQAELSDCTWIKIKFSQDIDDRLLENLSCMINVFPAINVNKVTKIFKTRKYLNLFALRDEDSFFDLETIEDDNGTSYQETKSEKITDIEENYFLLRGSGIEGFDERKASEHITYLLEKLKNESASFSFLDKTAFNGDLLKLSQIIARLELNQESLPDFSNTFYLYLNTKTENQTVFVNYYNTLGNLANGLKPGTSMSTFKGSQFAQASVKLITSSTGGRSKMTREDRVNTFRKALLSRDRIVTEEDIKSYGSFHFGRFLHSMEIKKGVQINNSAKGAFERTIDVYLTSNKSEVKSETELNFLCKDFLVTLQENSSNIFPYRIFIDHSLIVI